MKTVTRPNGNAPLPSNGNKGSKGGRVALAWQSIWDRLSTTEYVEGMGLAERAALEFDLKPQSIMSHLHRMAAEGYLDVDHRNSPVEVTRGPITFTSQRKRSYFRISR